MLLSSRSSPPKPLKITGSERSSYLSVKHLIPRTPIPSPSLPSILPRHGKKPPKLNSRKIIRSLLWLAFFITAWYIVAFGRKQSQKLTELTFLTSLGKTYEIVEAFELPDHATPISLTDDNGKSYWTISIPQRLGFPLPHTDYADVCSQVEDVARHVAGSDWHGDDHEDYYHVEPDFIDVDEAQAQHFLPNHTTSSRKLNDLPFCEKTLTYVLDAADAGLGSTLMGLFLSYGLAKHEGRTFFIDDTHFPYGQYSTFFTSKPSPNCQPPLSTQRVPCPHQAKHLVVSGATTSWMFGESFHAHFSQREIFDMARSGYEALFHITQPDASYIQDRISKLRSPQQEQQQQQQNQNHQHQQKQNHLQQTPTQTQVLDPTEPTPEIGLVGIHIRRGDRHPLAYIYSHGYTPPEHYFAAASKLIGQSSQWRMVLASDDPDMYDHDHTHLHSHSHSHPAASAPESEQAVTGGGSSTTTTTTNKKDDMIIRAQTKISLASKKKLDAGLGWEGGFFKDLFWSLGLPDHAAGRTMAERLGSPKPVKTRPAEREKQERQKQKEKEKERQKNTQPINPKPKSQSKNNKNTLYSNSNAQTATVDDNDADETNTARDYRTHPTKPALELREFLARAYLLDVSVLAHSDKIVCGVASYTCRLLAVMLGWERAFEKGAGAGAGAGVGAGAGTGAGTGQGDWINVDGAFAWRAVDY